MTIKVERDIEIRPAQPADLPALAALKNHYIVNTARTLKTECTDETKFLTLLSDKGRQKLPWLVACSPGAVEGEGVLGYAYLSEYRGGSNKTYRHTLELAVWVHPNSQRRGVGSKLITAIVDTITSPESSMTNGDAEHGPRGPRSVIAMMLFDQQDAASSTALQRFYEKHGFQLKGQLDAVGFKFGKWLDTLILQKQLW